MHAVTSANTPITYFAISLSSYCACKLCRWKWLGPSSAWSCPTRHWQAWCGESNQWQNCIVSMLRELENRACVWLILHGFSESMIHTKMMKGCPICHRRSEGPYTWCSADITDTFITLHTSMHHIILSKIDASWLKVINIVIWADCTVLSNWRLLVVHLYWADKMYFYNKSLIKVQCVKIRGSYLF